MSEIQLPTEDNPAVVIQGDALAVLRTMPDGCVQCCVTSPPYFGLRDYGVAGQIGLEGTPGAFIARLVDVFREVRRVLRDDGVCFLNIGDSYASGGRTEQAGFKPKDRLMIPARLAIALQADGWYLRDEIVWHKPNPMPESVTDRCTKAHEMIYLLAKRGRYYFDSQAISEPLIYPDETRRPLGSKGAWQMDGREQRENGGGASYDGYPATRNRRSVWTVTTKPYAEAHFATFPPDLVEPMILAGTSAKGCCPACGDRGGG